MIFNLHNLKFIELDTFEHFIRITSFKVHDNIKEYDFQSYKGSAWAHRV